MRRTACHDLLDEAAAAAPDGDALVYTDLRWSWRETRDRAREAARALLALGLERHDRVALWATNRPEWIVLQFGCSYAGLTLVPLNPLYREREVTDVVRRSGARALFVESEDRGVSLWDMAVPASRAAGCVSHVVPVDGSAWHDFLSGAAQADEQLLEATGAQPDDIAQIQFTSGTTGAPKGAALRHVAITNNPRRFAARAEIGTRGRMCTALPLFHCGGSVSGVLACAATQTTLMPLRRFDARQLIDIVDAEQATSLAAVPAMMLAVEAELARGGGSLESLEVVITGGSLVPPELLRRWGERFGVRFTITYGQTEASPVVTQSAPSDSVTLQVETVGRPLPDVELDVVDPETGARVAIGDSGEIRTRGPFVMAGYHGDVAATRAAIRDGGWLRTGDLGRLDEDGYLRITGRAKDIIIRGGENIDPAEIEAALRALAGVVEAFVVGVPDDRYGEACAAFVRLEDGATLDVETMRAGLDGQIARFKIPSHLRLVDAYPLTPSAKVQKFKLREMFAG